ncbi:unnamed protein product, partial [Hapterophycus canaliculatus]
MVDVDLVGGDDHYLAACAPPIEVVHAFGSCPDRVRDNICALDEERVVYVVGSRVAVTASAERSASSEYSCSSSSSSSALEFLSTGLRVARVTAVACSADRRFVAVCYKAVVEHDPNQTVARATVYHIPTQPRPSRVKTLSYERPRRQQQAGSALGRSGSGTGSCGSSATTRSSADRNGGGVPGDCKRRPQPPKALPSATAEFTTAAFSHDGELLALLDGSPEWTLLWFEWKTGKRMFTLRLDSAVYRVALSPLDHSKTATAGTNGLFSIWSTQQGGKVSSMAPIPGLRKASCDVCYRDVAWLNGDRLVLVAHEGIVTLVSPSDVLQEWDLGGFSRLDRASQLSSPSPGIPLGDGAGDGADSVGTDETLSAGEYGVSLNVVAIHARGFLVGDSQGGVKVFEQAKKAGGGGSGRDLYTLMRVLRIFGADLVELRPTVGMDYRWLLAGAGDGEIGLVDTNGLFSAVPDGDSLASTIGCCGEGGGGEGGGGQPARQKGGSTVAGGTARTALEERTTKVPRLCHGDPPPGAATGGAMTTAAVTAAGVALETTSAAGDGVVSRGFAKAMDAFEDSLRAAADAELGSTAGESKKLQKQQHLQHAKKGSRAATTAATAAPSASSASRSPTSGEATEAKLLYRPVTRGLGVRRRRPLGGHKKRGGGEAGWRRRGSLTCLAVCARRPFLAAIARGGGVSLAEEAGACRRCGDEEADDVGEAGLSGSSGCSDPGVPQNRRQRKESKTAAGGFEHGADGFEHGAEGRVEIQIWNYRTKQLVVRHPFGGDDPTGSGGGVDELVGTVVDARGDDTAGGDVDQNNGAGGDGDATCPVAISLHPSGDSIAVAFPHYVNVFFIVGCGGESCGDDNGGGGDEGVPDASASGESLSMSMQQTGLAQQADAAGLAPMATLRSDQREFFTKGMFSVSGEHEPVVNCDPVSAVHYSPGGHLLAVVTGKV